VSSTFIAIAVTVATTSPITAPMATAPVPDANAPHPMPTMKSKPVSGWF
jgi:hypothetical protein